MSIREIAIASLLLATVVAGFLLFGFARFVASSRFKWVRVVGAVLVSLAAFGWLGWNAKRSGRMPAPVFTIESPDSQLVSEIIEPNGDPLPTHLVRISIRPRGHFFATEVFAGPVEPNIKWLDNQTLLLTFPATPEKPRCGANRSNAIVICNEISAEDFKPLLRE